VTAPNWVDAHVIEYLERAVELYSTHDLRLMQEGIVTDDCAFIDHRPLGGEPIVGRAPIGRWLSEVFRLLPDWSLAIEVIDQRGDVYLAKDTYSGRDDRGGEAMLEWYVVDTLRDGLLAREEMFDDLDTARAAFEQTAAA
jgi:hypothetical protein